MYRCLLYIKQKTKNLSHMYLMRFFFAGSRILFRQLKPQDLQHIDIGTHSSWTQFKDLSCRANADLPGKTPGNTQSSSPRSGSLYCGQEAGAAARDRNHVLSGDPCPENTRLALGHFLHVTHVGASHLKNLKDSRATGNVPFRFFFGQVRQYAVGNHGRIWLKTSSSLTPKPSDFLGAIFGCIEEHFTSLASGIVSESKDHRATQL